MVTKTTMMTVSKTTMTMMMTMLMMMMMMMMMVMMKMMMMMMMMMILTPMTTAEGGKVMTMVSGNVCSFVVAAFNFSLLLKIFLVALINLKTGLCVNFLAYGG